MCAASLPTTMGIVAGLLVQNVLKYLLEFGQVSYYLGYNAMNNYFPSEIVRPNIECVGRACRLRCADWMGKWSPDVWQSPAELARDAEPVDHGENEWGICAGSDKDEEEGGEDVGESGGVASVSSETKSAESGPPDGAPPICVSATPILAVEAPVEEESLEDLMGELDGL